MDNVKDLILKYGKDIFESRNDKNAFILHVSDFIEFINRESYIQKITDRLENQSKKELSKIIKKEKVVVRELEKNFDDIKKKITKSGVTSEKLHACIKKVEGLIAGSIRMSGLKSDNLNNELNEIYYTLKEINKEELVKEFYIEKLDGRLFSKKLNDKRILVKKFNNDRKNELWGIWDYLRLMPLAKQLRNDYWIEPLVSDHDDFDQDLVSEKVRLMHFKLSKDNYYDNLPNEYISHINRIINYILGNISRENMLKKLFLWLFDMKNPIMYFLIAIALTLLYNMLHIK